MDRGSRGWQEQEEWQGVKCVSAIPGINGNVPEGRQEQVVSRKVKAEQGTSPENGTVGRCVRMEVTGQWRTGGCM